MVDWRGCREAVDAAAAESKRLGKPVSIAFVDAAGVLVHLERLDGAAAFTAIVAEAKACGSALMGRDSAALQSMVTAYPQILPALTARLAGRFIPVQGAVVMQSGDVIVGAVGVSGAAAEEDEEMAKIAASAIFKTA